MIHECETFHIEVPASVLEGADIGDTITITAKAYVVAVKREMFRVHIQGTAPTSYDAEKSVATLSLKEVRKR